MRPLWIGLPVVLSLTCSALASGQSPGRPELPARFEASAVDAFVRDAVERKGLTGLALAVVREGEVVLAKGYGKRSLDPAAPVELDTPFAVGSVTKQFACACVLLLAEEGKLSVDDTLARFFPDLPHSGEITLLQLMNHTSGYPDYYPLDFVDRRLARPIAVDALIREYAGPKLDFAPGSRWSYSNTGYAILGRVVEKAGGRPFGEFLRDRILRPVGMAHAEFEPSSADPARARGYLPFALGPVEPATPEGAGWLYAAGGLWASAPDLARWDVALMAGQVLRPESLRRMTAPVTLKDGRVKEYGCGVNIRREAGEVMLAHGGAVSGFRATNILIPRTRSAVVVLINDEQSDPGLAEAIAGLLARSATAEDLPRVAGPPAGEAALAFFRQMQEGTLDRSKLGEEFSAYLTDERIKASAARLKALGVPEKVEVVSTSERGGMEVASIRLTFATATLRGLLYRSTDGKIQQLLFEKG